MDSRRIRVQLVLVERIFEFQLLTANCQSPTANYKYVLTRSVPLRYNNFKNVVPKLLQIQKNPISNPNADGNEEWLL